MVKRVSKKHGVEGRRDNSYSRHRAEVWPWESNKGEFIGWDCELSIDYDWDHERQGLKSFWNFFDERCESNLDFVDSSFTLSHANSELA